MTSCSALSELHPHRVSAKRELHFLASMGIILHRKKTSARLNLGSIQVHHDYKEPLPQEGIRAIQVIYRFQLPLLCMEDLMYLWLQLEQVLKRTARIVFGKLKRGMPEIVSNNFFECVAADFGQRSTFAPSRFLVELVVYFLGSSNINPELLQAGTLDSNKSLLPSLLASISVTAAGCDQDLHTVQLIVRLNTVSHEPRGYWRGTWELCTSEGISTRLLCRKVHMNHNPRSFSKRNVANIFLALSQKKKKV